MAIQAKQTAQQQLILAPNVTLALEILRMPTLELKAFLERHLEENPLLELEESQDDELDQLQPESNNEEEAPSSALDEEWLSHWQNSSEQERPDDDGSENRSLEQRLALPQSLLDSLRLQIGCQPLSELQQRLGEVIIEHINEDGYLEDPLEDIAAQTSSSLEQLENALKIIQSCDPPGVGARNLRECLMLQLESQEAEESTVSNPINITEDPQNQDSKNRRTAEKTFIAKLAYRIIQDHFQLFVQRGICPIAKATGASQKEVAQACDILKKLEPKPGRAFAGELPPCIVPDLIIRKREKYFDVEVNDQEIPTVAINSFYYRMLKNPNTPTDAKMFLLEKFRKASWLIKAIEERNGTILSIARCLISLQRDFLDHGPQALKPLTQAQVAEIVARHPSTVSRAISGKTIDTPYGIFRLEQLFATALHQDRPRADFEPASIEQNNRIQASGKTDNAVSDEKIKAEIQSLIENEDADNPLNDLALTQRLAQRNFLVARRTVAKYRTSLRILPAHLRKRRI